MPGYRQLKLTFENETQCLTLMRDRIALGAVRLDDVDVAFEQIAGAERHQVSADGARPPG